MQIIFVHRNTETKIYLDTATTNESETKPSFFQLSEVRLYTVLGLIAALVVVAILQATCTIYKTSKSSRNQKVSNAT